jgi:hypothetical protein
MFDEPISDVFEDLRFDCRLFGVNTMRAIVVFKY